jgi:hypothetical protein
MASWTVAIVLLAHVIWFRYTLPLFPFLLIWAGNGARELCDWSVGTARSVLPGRSSSTKPLETITGLVTVAFVLGTSVAFGWKGTSQIAEVTEGFGTYRMLKEAGLWLRDHDGGPKLIMDVGTPVAFYARGDLGGLPYASSDLALRYLEQSKRPDYIVLWSGSAGRRPYLADWLAHGIPSPHAELIHRIEHGQDDVLALYRWKGGQPVVAERMVYVGHDENDRLPSPGAQAGADQARPAAPVQRGRAAARGSGPSGG